MQQPLLSQIVTNVHRRLPRIQEESGQSLVIVALLMLIFIGVVGLVIDIGYGYVRYRQVQTAADIAALAGARELAMENGEVAALTRMQQLLNSNGASSDASDYSVIDRRALVTARTTIDTLFLPLFNIENFTVSAEAEAIYGQSAAEDSLLPFAVREDLWNLGQETNIWTGETGIGNFGWVRWEGQSISTTVLRMNIDDLSNSGTLQIGDEVAGKTGVSFSAVRPSLEAKIGDTVSIFFYDPEEVTGAGANLRYTVTGFGRFLITDIQSNGTDSEIRGFFVQTVLLGGEIDPNRTLGTLATGLVQ